MDNKQEVKKDKYLNSPKEFILEMPLYYEIDFTNPEIQKLILELISFDGTLDAFCVWCNKDSVFETETNSERMYVGFHRIDYQCTRNANHEYSTYFLIRGDQIQKIGQFPSIADFQIPQAEKYRKILGEEQYKELTKAIGLVAHGVGIGSFVYLRRIFENLIEEAHVKAKSQDGFSEDEYFKSRMDEKISLLKAHLPKFLVENKNLYKILSKGIHALKEDECLEYFEAVKIGIEQILDEKIEETEKVEKARKAREAVQKLIQNS